MKTQAVTAVRKVPQNSWIIYKIQTVSLGNAFLKDERGHMTLGSYTNRAFNKDTNIEYCLVLENQTQSYE